MQGPPRPPAAALLQQTALPELGLRGTKNDQDAGPLGLCYKDIKTPPQSAVGPPG